MKKFYLSLIFIFLLTLPFSKANAQWVTIPDANFAAYLQLNFPSCMNGNLMDTTCSGVVNAIIVGCNGMSIQDIDGIQYFDNLVELQCGNNQLTALPDLPASLYVLRCQSNQLPALPVLPSGLGSLYCHTNLISNLPAIPASLIRLYCGSNQITSLPVLPATLQDLECSLNQITFLDPLPTSLVFLNCAYNQLTSIPALPPNLQGFGCQYNLLTSLPPLPANLANFYCDHNLLTSLPPLPNLYSCICNNNQLTCIPPLPNTIGSNYFSISNNPFTCLPNYIAAMDSTLLAIPLCVDNDLINNPNLCTGFKGVYGYTYRDASSDCSFDWADDFLENIPVKLFDSTGLLINTFYSLSNGLYSYIQDTGTYTIVVDTLNKPYETTCIYPGADSTFNLTTASPLAKIDFEIACKTSFDVGVKSINTTGLIFPGQHHQLHVAAGDLNKWYNLNCTGGLSGIVEITVSGPVTFSSIPFNALTPNTISNNIFTYNITDFGTLNLNSFAIEFITNTTAQADDTICVTVNITPTVGDNNTTNNIYTYCYSVRNAYDPNEKEVYPANVPALYNDWFTYTIHFQNTGNAPAQNIRITDSLDSLLGLSTFEIINYSHLNTSTLTNNIATFRFPAIQLPDSTTDAEGSKGFIQYRIKPHANLPLGTQINNTAHIYFDYNAPIATNNAQCNFVSPVGISNTKSQTPNIKLFPNPITNNILKINFQSSLNSPLLLVMYDITGRKVFSEKINSAAATQTIVLPKLANGVYTCEFISKDFKESKKLVVVSK